MTTPTTVPTGPAGDPGHRPADNDPSALHVTSGTRLWHRVGIAAEAHTCHPTSTFIPEPLLAHLAVEVGQGCGGGLRLVIDDPDAADDLAAALTWAATRLRELLDTGAPGSDRRTFGLADPTRPMGLPTAPAQDAAEDTTAATKEAA